MIAIPRLCVRSAGATLGMTLLRARHRAPSLPLLHLHGPFGVTTNVPPSLRPFTAGLYISSACAGGRTNVPGVVARATYVAVYVPGHSTFAEYTTRSSRISR